MSLDNLADLGGLLVGFLLTLFIFSYVIKDNPLYRLAVHILVGVGAGYAIVVVVEHVLLPIAETVRDNPTDPGTFVWVVPFLLAALLLLKAVPRLAWLGNSAMAVIIGIGAAVGLVGAIVGTIWPQVTAQHENAVVGLVVALLAVCALFYFQFSARFTENNQVTMPRWYKAIGIVGRGVITVTLAGLFAGVLSTSLILLAERVGFFVESVANMLATLGL